MFRVQSQSILYLSSADLQSLAVGMKEFVTRLELTFMEKAKGPQGVEMPPKPGIHPKSDAFIHAMPAYVPAMDVAGLKWVSGYPANPKSGIPYITGLLILNDVSTGIPLAVMDCAWITAMRTAAATAVAARHLARRDSHILGIIACGVQGHFHLESLLLVCPQIDTVMLYDVREEAALRLQARARERFGLSAIIVASPTEATKAADVVVTSLPIVRHPNRSIGSNDIKEGTFLGALDFDASLKESVFDVAKNCVVDDRKQYHYYSTQGYFKNYPLATDCNELCDIVAGRTPGRIDEREIWIALNLGLAIGDVAVAKMLYDAALEKGVGQKLQP